MPASNPTGISRRLAAAAACVLTVAACRAAELHTGVDAESDRRRFWVSCHDCNEAHVLDFDNVRLESLVFAPVPHACGGYLAAAAISVDASAGSISDAVYAWVRKQRRRAAQHPKTWNRPNAGPP